MIFARANRRLQGVRMLKSVSALTLGFLLAAITVAQAQQPLVDGDGVPNQVDACPYSAPGTGAGCSLPGDADGDGVADDRDDCPYTPHGARVDAHGCAIDSDFDGVPDGLDQCPQTPYGEAVDQRGCAAGETLARANAADSSATALPQHSPSTVAQRRRSKQSVEPATSSKTVAPVLPMPNAPAARTMSPNHATHAIPAPSVTIAPNASPPTSGAAPTVVVPPTSTRP